MFSMVALRPPIDHVLLGCLHLPACYFTIHCAELTIQVTIEEKIRHYTGSRAYG